MNSKIGVMQGRLLPKYQGRYQAHPKDYWQEEFLIAKNIGLDCIEFILDFDDAETNPLLTKVGCDNILNISRNSGIFVNTICADYFMEAPLHSVDESIAKKSLNVLTKLLHNAAKLDVTDIVIPCVDQASFDGLKSTSRFINIIQLVLPLAEKYNINLSLETDLAPQPFLKLLNDCRSSRVTVNYDIGNSAALGFDPLEELDAYGDYITDVHIKDRPRNSSSVVLGTGAADFKLFFEKLADFNYTGPLIMQAYRDDEGVEVFKLQLDWVKSYL